MQFKTVTMIKEIGNDWIYLRKEEKLPYEIYGKYLFFNEDMERLIKIAEKEIETYDFHVAKVSNKLHGSNTEHVLCLYYENDSRKYELADRNKQEYDVKYRFWKSDAATRKGEYSQEFLSKLSEHERKFFMNNNSNLSLIVN